MMNPQGNFFDLNRAKVFLNFAIYFTPQYGDSFIEGLKLNLLLGHGKGIQNLKKKTVNAQPNYGHLWYFCKDSLKESSM